MSSLSREETKRDESTWDMIKSRETRHRALDTQLVELV